MTREDCTCENEYKVAVPQGPWQPDTRPLNETIRQMETRADEEERGIWHEAMLDILIDEEEYKPSATLP